MGSQTNFIPVAFHFGYSRYLLWYFESVLELNKAHDAIEEIRALFPTCSPFNSPINCFSPPLIMKYFIEKTHEKNKT